MDEQKWMLFSIIYGIAALLLIVQVIRDYRQGHSWKRIGKDLISPLSIILGTMILWYAMVETGAILDTQFKF